MENSTPIEIATHSQWLFENGVKQSRVTIVGNTITAWRDGVQVSQVTDSSTLFSNVTTHGILGYIIDAQNIDTFDDFSIQPLSLTDGHPLQVWRDLSGKGRNQIQTDLASQPIYRTTNKNLLTYTNATFENGVGDWITDSATTLPLSVSTAWSASGTASLVLNKTANYEVASVVLPIAYSKVVPGRTYSAESTWRTADISRSVQMSFTWRDANFNPITSVSGTKPADTTTIDVRASIEAVAPPGAVSVMMYLGVFVPSTAAGEIHYVDKIGLYEGSLPYTWVPPVTLPNGLPTVQFMGKGGLSTNIPDLGSVMTFYLVHAPEAKVAGDTVHIAGVANRGVSSSGGSSSYYLYGGGGFINSGTQEPLGNTNVVTGILNGAQSIIAVNGVARPAGDAGSLPVTSNLFVGGGVSPHAEYSAVLMFSGAHNDATRKRVEKWLGAKYGVAVAG